MNHKLNHKRIVIIGGGPVAYVAALNLANYGLEVSICDPIDISLKLKDRRVIALSYASYEYLKQFNIWHNVQNTPIKQIHISKSGFGATIINAKDLSLDHVGCTVSYAALLKELYALITQNSLIEILKYEVKNIIAQDDQNILEYVSVPLFLSVNNKQDLTNKLIASKLILADGGNLMINGVEYDTFNYKQVAIVANLQVTKNNQYQSHQQRNHKTNTSKKLDMAYERFAYNNTFALLPNENLYTLILTHNHHVINTAINTAVNSYKNNQELAYTDFLVEYIKTDKFFRRFDKVDIASQVFSYPLYKSFILNDKNTTIKNAPLFIVGNAAQVLHPISAQGLNLGLRDVKILCRNLYNAIINKQTFTANDYYIIRNPDRKYAINFTDQLARFLHNNTTDHFINNTNSIARVHVNEQSQFNEQAEAECMTQVCFKNMLLNVGFAGFSNISFIRNQLITNLIFGI